jgi:iron complex transport system substrate-binding protein
MAGSKKIILFYVLVLIINLQVIASVITDMAGRSVVLPDKISCVLPYDNKTNVLVYPVAGPLMKARARAMESPYPRYISNEYIHLIEIDTKNIEEVLKFKPDVVIAVAFIDKGEDLSKYVILSEKTGIPVVIVELDLLMLDKSLIFLGKIFGNQSVAEKCSDFIRNVYNIMAQDLKTYKVNSNVYLSYDNNGLRTAPAGSNHSQVFNVLRVPIIAKSTLDAKSFSTVSMEQIILWNPEYIFCLGKWQANPYRMILKSALWRNMIAVKNNQVFIVPSEPFPWFDMPPSVNRIPGTIWLMQLFYNVPADFTMQKIKEFYQIFYKYNLTDKEYAALFEWK